MKSLALLGIFSHTIIYSSIAFAQIGPPQNITSVEYMTTDSSGIGEINGSVGIYNGGQLLWEDSQENPSVTLNGGTNTSMWLDNGEAYIYNRHGTATFNMEQDTSGVSWQHVIKMGSTGKITVGDKENNASSGASVFKLTDGNIYASGTIQINKTGFLNLITTNLATASPASIYLYEQGRLENSGTISLTGDATLGADYNASLSIANGASYQGWTRDQTDGYGKIELNKFADVVNFGRGDQTADLWRNIVVSNAATTEKARILNFQNGETWLYGNGDWRVGEASTFQEYKLDASAGFVDVDIREQTMFVAKGAMWNQKSALDGANNKLNFNLAGSKLFIEEGGWFRTEGTFNNGGAVILRPNSRFSFGANAIYQRGVNIAEQKYYYNWAINSVGANNNGSGDFYIEGDQSTIIDIGSSDRSMWRDFLGNSFNNPATIYLRADMNPQMTMQINGGVFNVVDDATLTLNGSASVGASEFLHEGWFKIGNADALNAYDTSASGTVNLTNGALLYAPTLWIGTSVAADTAKLVVEASTIKTNDVTIRNKSLVTLNASNFSFANFYAGATTSAADTSITLTNASALQGSTAVFDQSTLSLDGSTMNIAADTVLQNNAQASFTAGSNLQSNGLTVNQSSLSLNASTIVARNLNATQGTFSLTNNAKLNGYVAFFDNSTLAIDGTNSALNSAITNLRFGAQATLISGGQMNVSNLLFINSGSALTNTSGQINSGTLNMNNATFSSAGSLTFGGTYTSANGNSYFANSSFVGAGATLSANFMTVNSGSELTLNPLGNFATTTQLTAATGMNVFGTLSGSARINTGSGDLKIQSGGVLRLAAEDGMTLSRDIYFESNSTYHASINTRDLGADDDIQSQIKAREAFFTDSTAKISVGANQRPDSQNKKYAILVTDTESHNKELNVNNNLVLRTSLLTDYKAYWETGTADFYNGKQVLSIQVFRKPGVTLNSLATRFSFNRRQMAMELENLREQSDLADELEDELEGLLNHIELHVNDSAELDQILRDTALTSYANQTAQAPQMARTLSGGVGKRLNSFKMQKNATENGQKSFALSQNPFWLESSLSSQEFPQLAALEGFSGISGASPNNATRLANIAPTISYTRQNSGDEQGFSAHTQSLAFGVDHATENTIFGASFAYGKSKLKASESPQTIKTDAFQLGAYGQIHIDNWFFKSQAAYTHLENDSETSFQNLYPAAFGLGVASAEFNSNIFSLSAHAGYDFFFGNTIFTPSAGLNFAHISQGEFSENGAGGLNRSIAAVSYNNTEAEMKLQLAFPFKDGNNISMRPSVFVEYGRQLNEVAQVSGGFSGTGQNVIAHAANTGKNRFAFGVALDAQINKLTAFSMNYQLTTKENYQDHLFGLSLDYRF